MDHLPVIFAIPAQGSLTNLKEMNKIMYQFTVKSLINWIHATTGISIQQKPAIEHTTTNSDNRELTSLSWFSKLFVKLWPYIFPLYCLYVKRQTIMESLAEWQNPSYIAKFLIVSNYAREYLPKLSSRYIYPNFHFWSLFLSYY